MYSTQAIMHNSHLGYTIYWRGKEETKQRRYIYIPTYNKFIRLLFFLHFFCNLKGGINDFIHVLRFKLRFVSSQLYHTHKCILAHCTYNFLCFSFHLFICWYYKCLFMPTFLNLLYTLLRCTLLKCRLCLFFFKQNFINASKSMYIFAVYNVRARIKTIYTRKEKTIFIEFI